MQPIVKLYQSVFNNPLPWIAIKMPLVLKRVRACFERPKISRLIRWVAIYVVLVMNFMHDHQGLAQSGDFRAQNSTNTVPVASDSYGDPSIVRTQHRTAGAQTFQPSSAVQSAQWNGPSPSVPTNNVTQSSFDRKADYSLPFRTDQKKAGDVGLKKPTSSWSSTISMFVSLLIVIGLFLLVARIFRSVSPTQQRFLPKEVVQVIGRTPLGPRQQMFLVQFGGKLLLVSQQLGQTTTLSEIDNLDEVAHILGVCEQQSATSISNSFRDVLTQITLGAPKETAKASIRQPRSTISKFEKLG